MARIAWIGAGKMGLPICKRLKAAGHNMRVLARRPEQEMQFRDLGFECASTVNVLVDQADLVFTSVTDDQALGSVVLQNSFKQALAPSAIFIDMSTVSPTVSTQIAQHLGSSNPYLRAPVSGSTGMAEAGTLTALVSGPKQAFDQLSEIFAVFTKKAFYLGEAEEARYLKLAINSMVAATSALLGEALAFGLKGGLSNEAMLDVINQSAVASPLIGYKKDMIVSGDYKPAATLDMLKKDVELLISQAKEMDVPLPLNRMIREIYARASDEGLGEKDFFVLVAEAAKSAGISIAQ
jgi:3-hydroxyisobutyrate dehydrogenase-like beta-hydroxyacid dehydrogenase